MKALLLVTFCCGFASLAQAEDAVPASASTNPAPGISVETVKVTDQEPGLFERVRDTYLRAEKKGLIAANTTPTGIR
jgi:hypothetical protein